MFQIAPEDQGSLAWGYEKLSHTLEWKKNGITICTKIKQKFSPDFHYDCRQQTSVVLDVFVTLSPINILYHIIIVADISKYHLTQQYNIIIVTLIAPRSWYLVWPLEAHILLYHDL